VSVIGEDETFAVTIPEELAHDILQIIDFALSNDSAREVSRFDFNHCHVLISRETYNAPSEGSEQMASTTLSNYVGLLCHTQELVMHDASKRNIVMWRGSTPQIQYPSLSGDIEGQDGLLDVRIFDFEIDTGFGIGQNTGTLYPADLGQDIVGNMTIRFAVSGRGSYFFELACTCK